ncbi:capsid cement protein [Thiorhodococcus fuscus]|uniref:Capsid cement protein n=1 Tax=Thiorhodococcus fuscus TaxID=527200 RepID=A0ABW4Y8R7_9GAMM
MANNYKQSGEVLDWTNATGSDVGSGSVVVVGGILGVALVDIADGARGSVQIQGVFTVPKVEAAVIAQGEPLIWHVSARAFTSYTGTPPEMGDILYAAFAFEAAGAGVASIAVKFTGSPGQIAGG